MLGLNTAANFTISGGVTVDAAVAGSDRTYADLTCTGMTQGSPYTVTCGAGITDDDPEALDATADEATFDAGVAPGGGVNASFVDGFFTSSRAPRSFENTQNQDAPVLVDGYKSASGRALYYSFNGDILYLTGPLEEGIVQTFMMRAYHNVLLKHVYWESNDEPDFAATKSGYVFGNLEDIVLLANYFEQ
jgi:hypothetical protein